MSDYGSLAHSKWDCKYHIVFIPKYRKKKLFCQVRRYLGDVFHELARQKNRKIVEGHMMSDHVHTCVSIPPKHSVAQVIGYIKGKAQLLWHDSLGGENAISMVKDCGRADMRFPPLGLNWIRCRNTSGISPIATRMTMMTAKETFRN